MSLEEKLAAIRAAAVDRVPEEARMKFGRATQELRDSGIVDRAIQAGDALPAFTLKNADGAHVSSAALLAKGPLVVTVFRGHW